MLDLLERDPQLATLHTYFGQAARGAGHLVFLGAEAGAGKTALVQAFGDAVSAHARILTGWCDPLAAPRPAGPLVDMAHGLGEPVRTILQGESRTGLFDAMYAELSTPSAAPTALVFEDVHWADDTTLDLLRFLGRRIGMTHAVVIATYRDDATGPDHPLRTRLGDLATQESVSRMQLAPLSESAVATLAAGTSLDPHALWKRTAGNAFYVSELLQAGPDDVPATIADAVVARVGRLSPAARQALTMTAVVGSRAQPSLLFRVPGVDALAIDECIQAGLLRLAPPVFMFRHELVRQAVLSVLGVAQRQQLNADVLAALRAGPIEPDELARLAEFAENAADTAAVLELAPAAARRSAGLGSHREAAAQYDRALRFAPPASTDPQARAGLLEPLSVELYLTGQLVPAIQARADALAIRRAAGQPHRVGDNLRWLARLYWYAARRDQGERCAQEALDVLTPLGASPELAMAMSLRSQLLMLGGEYDGAIDWGLKALDLAQELELPEVSVHAANNVGASESALGVAGGIDRLRESLRGSLELQAEDHAARAYVNLGHHYVAQRRLDEAEALLSEGIAYCTARDLDLQVPYLRAIRALLLVHRGRWQAAIDEADQVLALVGITSVHRFVALLPRSIAQARIGVLTPAAVDELRDMAHALDESQRLAPYASVAAEMAWLAGRRLEAGDDAIRVYDRARATGDRRDLTELTLWLRRTDAPIADDQHPVQPVGPLADALTDPAAAAARLETLGNPYDAALLWLDCGEPGLRRALEIFTDLGARPAAAVATARLRALGAVNIPRGPRRATQDNPHGLTGRQLEVLELVAARLTNAEIAERLFLSERTVDHHVSAILGKLDVASRDDAARKLGHGAGRR